MELKGQRVQTEKQLIRSDTRESILTLTLNRPEKLNAFAGDMRALLLEKLRLAGESDSVRVVVVTGEGRAFCAGGDVEFMQSLRERGDVAGFRTLLDAGAAVVRQIATMPKPVIAAVNGIAAGAGFNLALACDYRIASEAATFAQSFVRIGLQPDWGGTWTLPRLVGRSRAFEIMCSGRTIRAEEALRLGIVDQLAAEDDLAAETRSLASEFATAPRGAVSSIKRCLALSDANDLAAQLELESAAQVDRFQSADAAEGLTAFFEKRKPHFR